MGKYHFLKLSLQLYTPMCMRVLVPNRKRISYCSSVKTVKKLYNILISLFYCQSKGYIHITYNLYTEK